MPSSIVEIVESKRKEEWILVQRDGTGHHCIIKTPFLVTRHLISLKLKSKESNLIFPMVIFSDAITQEEMRRLRYCFRNK